MEAIAPRIRFPARTQYLKIIRSFCREVLGGNGEEKVHRKVVLAIDEAIANIIEHAYAGDRFCAGASIELSIEVQSDRIVASIIDRGPPFDPRSVWQAVKANGGAAPAAAAAAPEGRPPVGAEGQPRGPQRFPQRGFGLHLIRLIVDEIDYRRTPEGENLLVLTKHLKKG
jgi:anti-sigma regulatory factor (Ser/Thr protein kinase)